VSSGAGDLFRGRLDRPTLAGLGRLLDRLADAMAGAGVADSHRRSVGLVADELVSNVLNHREGRDRPHVEIGLRRGPDGGLVLEIADDGPRFDPFSQADPQTDLALEARPVGGLGLLLVKSLCAERAYERRAERNLVTLVFPA
jgi:serine/threonine-protein kinase RsbW